MPRILRIINRFNIGGPTFNVTFLCSELADEYETLLVGGLPEKDEADSLHIPRSYGIEPKLIAEIQRQPNFKSDRLAYKKLKQLIREFKPDIVHTHASKAGALGRKAAKKCNVPILVHTFHGHVFHSYFGKIKTFIIKQIERYLAKNTTAIIAISDRQKYELTQIYKIAKPSKVHVINLGFDLDKFKRNQSKRIEIRHKLNLHENEIAIAIIGRLAPVKNHSFFLQIIEEIALNTKTPFSIFIVGDGSERNNIQAKVDALKKNNNIRIELLGWEREIHDFNNGMDLICLTSDNEGTPVSLIEAQASSIPVVTTDVGGVSDIVSEGKTGFIIPVGNLKMFSEKLRLLIDNKKIREEMSQNGWSHVYQKFSKETLGKNMKNLYTNLLNKRS